MEKILVTGANGNVGQEVVASLHKAGQHTKSAVMRLSDPSSAGLDEQVLFDFADASTWEKALEGVDKLFLMRPPAISDVRKYLFPFIDLALSKNVKQIVFLSLQGVQFNPLTPHYKVERYLRKKNAPYTFLRPNFFMQNLTTFYRDGVALRNEVFLPAGMGKTAFIDTRDIGTVAAKVLTKTGHLAKAYTLSGLDSLNYDDVAHILSNVLKRKITYKNPTVQEYVDKLRLRGENEDFIKVQKMLYFVVRHNFSSSTTSDIEKLLGVKPISFEQFAKDHARFWKKD